MIDVTVPPKSLEDLVNLHGFVDNGNSVQKVWDKILEVKGFDGSDDDLDELYECGYRELDTYPRGLLLDILASSITRANWWPVNSDGQENDEIFLKEYVNAMINDYGFEKDDE